MGYQIGDKEYRYDSCVNQDICGKLVNREVFCCMTSEMEYLLQHSYDESDPLYSWDEVYECCTAKKCSECGEEDWFEEDDEGNYICKGCGHKYSEEEYEELDVADPEIYEWWAVSNWFGEKLREHGEVVLDGWNKQIWGRQCTGQAILLDWVIEKIAYDMGILDGQEYDWNRQEVESRLLVRNNE